MSAKLGEMLVRGGLISMEELEESLKSQVIFGGKLGTNMIEMGYIDEGKLAAALSRLFSVQSIHGDAIMNIPENIIRLLPKELVDKHKVIPLKLDRRRLSLAMVDPRNLPSIEEISFATGYIVDPVVCPEIRMVSALEKHYAISRARRYIKLQGESRARRPTSPVEASTASRMSSDRSEEVNPFQGLMTVSEADIFPREADFTVGIPRNMDVGKAPGEKTVSAVDAVLSDDDIVPPGEPVEVMESMDESDSLDSLSRILAEAGSRDDIAEAIIRYTGRKFNHVALFMVKGAMASGWIARCSGENVESFPLLNIPLDSPSVLKLVAEGKNIYIGPVPSTPCNDIMLRGLGKSRPETSLLIPLLMMGRVVTIFYADGSEEDLAEQMVELKIIVAKAAIAFEILILKNKLLSL